MGLSQIVIFYIILLPTPYEMFESDQPYFLLPSVYRFSRLT